MVRFTWDSIKAEMNRRKHGGTFTEAETAFAMSTAELCQTLSILTPRNG